MSKDKLDKRPIPISQQTAREAYHNPDWAHGRIAPLRETLPNAPKPKEQGK